MMIAIVILLVLLATALFAVGLYFVQKRFWVQDRNNSKTAPPSQPEGVGNELGDKNPAWRPPTAS
jgi:flagellar basal body-associated protein FliL